MPLNTSLASDVFKYLLPFLSYQELCSISLTSRELGKKCDAAWRQVFFAHFPYHIALRSQRSRTSAGSSSEESQAAEDLAELQLGGSKQHVDWKRLYSQMRQSLQMFNSGFEGSLYTWIAFWKESNVPDPRPEDADEDDAPDSWSCSIGHFLYTQINSIKRATLTEYLTYSSECYPNLYAFLDHFNFRGVAFDWALRMIFAIVHLPRSSKGVDRLLHAFAKTYCKQNPGVFSELGKVYGLGFSLIMLSTDLHNPAVKTKLTPAQFVSNSQGVVDTGAGKEMLERMYHSVRTCPMVLHMDKISLSGWLSWESWLSKENEAEAEAEDQGEASSGPDDDQQPNEVSLVSSFEGTTENLMNIGVGLMKSTKKKMTQFRDRLLRNTQNAWCVLQDSTFIAYDSPQRTKVLLSLNLDSPGVVQREGVSDGSAPSSNYASFLLPKAVSSRQGQKPIVLYVENQPHVFWASNSDVRESWLSAVHFHIHARANGLERFANCFP